MQMQNRCVWKKTQTHTHTSPFATTSVAFKRRGVARLSGCPSFFRFRASFDTCCHLHCIDATNGNWTILIITELDYRFSCTTCRPCIILGVGLTVLVIGIFTSCCNDLFDSHHIDRLRPVHWIFISSTLIVNFISALDIAICERFSIYFAHFGTSCTLEIWKLLHESQRDNTDHYSGFLQWGPRCSHFEFSATARFTDCSQTAILR